MDNQENISNQIVNSLYATWYTIRIVGPGVDANFRIDDEESFEIVETIMGKIRRSLTTAGKSDE
jgi:hypothetical protein